MSTETRNTIPTAFIFDMDGTIVDSMPYHTRTWLNLLAAEGVQVGFDEFNRRTGGLPNPEVVHTFFGAHLSDTETAAIAEQKENLYRAALRPDLKPIDGVIEFLREARRLNIPLALATSAPQENIEFILSGIQAREFFRVVVGVVDIQRGKPDPQIFLLAAERLGVPPEQCVAFEDSPAGVEAARRAGMKIVAVTSSVPASEFEGRSGVIRVIRDFTRLHPGQLT
jgi:beta-phosphoglucomutase family hydrolase